MKGLFPSQLLRRPSRSAQAFDAAAYWADRHATHAGSLAAVGHRQLSESENAAQYDLKRKKLLDVLNRHLPDPRGRTLLDAGCGIGVLSQAFADHGFSVSGVDFCESAICAAQERVPSATFLASPLDKLRLGTRFDAITIIDVLLHIVDDAKWRATLVALAAHLKPEGVMLILDSLSEDGQPDATHCRRRSKQDWERVFDELGLHMAQHERFELPYEAAIKDLLTCGRARALRDRV